MGAEASKNGVRELPRGSLAATATRALYLQRRRASPDAALCRGAGDPLEGIGLRDPAHTDPETLALGGAIYKRKWEYGGQIEHLYEALAFYRAAYERDPEADKGYSGVNAAYILDILSARA